MLPAWPIDLRQRPTLIFADQGVFRGPSQAHYVMGPVWCLHAYRYHGSVTINGVMVAFAPGQITITPPHAHLAYRFDDAENRHVSLQWVQPSLPAAPTVLAARYAAEDVAALMPRLETCLPWFATDRRRCEIRLWDALGDLVRPAALTTSAVAVADDRLHRALAFIESQLGSGIGISAVADAAGMTTTHLGRLFRARFGVSPGVYLRRRRSQRAYQLLVNGGRPIKDIATLVGLPDLQHFNKVIRRELGRSPRSLVAGALVPQLAR